MIWEKYQSPITIWSLFTGFFSPRRCKFQRTSYNFNMDLATLTCHLWCLAPCISVNYEFLWNVSGFQIIILQLFIFHQHEDILTYWPNHHCNKLNSTSDDGWLAKWFEGMPASASLWKKLPIWIYCPSQTDWRVIDFSFLYITQLKFTFSS